MRVFISYAHEDQTVADAIAVGLSQDGHEVFFDRDRLRAAEAFHAKIRRSVRRTQLFLFLISPSSLEASGYALTELSLARERWPNPTDRVLPILVRPVDTALLPPYLTSVTVLRASGNLVADVLARVAAIAKERARRRQKRVVAAASGVVAIALITLAVYRGGRFLHDDPLPCYLSITVLPADPNHEPLSRASVDVLYAGTSSSFPLSPRGEASIHVGPLAESLAEWRVRVMPAGEAPLGEAAVRGCPRSQERHPVGAGFEVTLIPR